MQREQAKGVLLGAPPQGGERGGGEKSSPRDLLRKHGVQFWKVLLKAALTAAVCTQLHGLKEGHYMPHNK